MKSQTLKDSRLRDQLKKKIKEQEDARGEIEKQRDMLKQEILQLEREIEEQRRQIEVDRKTIEEMGRERDLLQNNLRKTESATTKQADLVKIQENTRKNLEVEIQGYKAEAQKQRQVIYGLEKEREKYGQQASDATAKYMQALEEVKVREGTIAELQKKIQESDAKLKQQQNLYVAPVLPSVYFRNILRMYEQVRSDRNLYSKNLIEAEDEIAEMKRKFKIMNHQIEQLKEEITAKDHALVKEHFEHKKVEKERDSLKEELQELKGKVTEADETISSQVSEVQKLTHIINEADAERSRMKKEYVAPFIQCICVTFCACTTK